MFYKLSKATFVLFIFYIVWFQPVFSPINKAPLVLGVGMIVLLLLHKLSEKGDISFFISRPLILWGIFLIYIFITGFVLADNKGLFISSIITFLQTLAMMLFIIEVSRYEKSNDFFIKTYISLSILYAITLVFWGYEDHYGRITISELSNANIDGITMLYGIFCLLVSLDPKKNIRFILSFSSIVFLFYAIVQTASRKSFLAAAVLILLWFIFVIKKHWKISSIKNKIFLSVLMFFNLTIILFKIAPIFYDSLLFNRLTEDLGYEGDQARIIMYKVALDYFNSNPLFGIGFNQYRVLFGGSSHSTYAEIISTTGIIGTILYFIPYFIIIYNLLKVYVNKKQTLVAGQAMLYLILVGVMFALAAGVILFFNIQTSIMLALMITFYSNQKLTSYRLKQHVKK